MNYKYKIDINADVGERIGNETELMPYLSSCNIACGGHAGDLETMKTVVKLAKEHYVTIGAHPSFPDKKNFGRVELEISAADLYASLKHQIRLLQTVLHSEKLQLHHIKPHGALYNLASKDNKIARVLIEVVKSIPLPLKLYAPFNSEISKLASQENVEVVFEAFADRNYNEDLSLVSRQKKEAILIDSDQILSHVLEIIKEEKVTAINGKKIPIKASTFCVHGDTQNVIGILKYLSEKLPKNGVKIQ